MTKQDAVSSNDLTRTTLAVLFLCGLIVATFWIVRPFLSALLWATMIVISTWPLLLRLQAALRGSRALATSVMTLGILLIAIIPLGYSLGALMDNMDRIIAGVDSLERFELPPPPAWATEVPIVGPKLTETWQRITAAGPGGLAAKAQPYLGSFLRTFAGKIGNIGGMFLQFLLTVVISAILYSNGETAARGVCRFARRLAGSHGEQAALLAGNAIRGVAMGVVVTATLQAAIAGVGLAIAGIPWAALFTAVMFILCLAQLGPMPVMLPVVIWKFAIGDSLWGTILLVFTIVAGTLDGFVRPILIRKGADLPLLLIFAGVIGGLMALGIVGIFVGPVILAVTHTLLQAWVESRSGSAETAQE